MALKNCFDHLRTDSGGILESGLEKAAGFDESPLIKLEVAEFDALAPPARGNDKF